MVHETIEGTFRQTNLTSESAEYLAKREDLRLAEIELMRQRERVAELRRHLPPGPALEDYKFIEGPVDLDSGDTPTRTVRLSELFTATVRPLVALRSVGATILETHEVYGRYAVLWLGHAPRTVAEKHYVAPSQALFEEALLWLRGQILGV